ncbi:MAG: lipoate--protein ligase family protein [Candidatus Bathyarchaeota archaeon]|nr:lipoate--protein ligase family protein [Candidatus Bathyarchaeota archaeon]
MRVWRLLRLESFHPFMNMAIDEAILRARIAGTVPDTLRFYRWQPSAVSIGRFQKIENEVNLENCQRLGVEVVRRVSGGGTVYHDSEGEVTYSVVAKTENLGTKDLAEVYSKIYSAMSHALRLMGIVADYNGGDSKNCPNLTVNGKKISGSAQANKSGVVLQHGTLLLNVDLPKMFTLLRVPWASSCMQVVNVAKNKITSVQNELGHTIRPETVANAMAHGFAVALGIQVVEDVQTVKDELTTAERELAEKLYREKYATDKWNFNGESNLG